jgi:hypothetical protein
MPNYQLVVAFASKRIFPLTRLGSPSETISFVYLGGDFFLRQYLERALGPGFKRIDIAKLHDEVADDLRRDHMEWIDRLNRQYGAAVEWWFSPIASRDIYVSNLWQYTCYLEILARLWRDPANRPQLVLVESFGLAKAIARWAARESIALRVVNGVYGRYRYWAKYCCALAKWGYFALTLGRRRVAAHATKKSSGPRPFSATDLVILDTFVHDSCLKENDKFEDRYCPYLHEYLAVQGFSVAVHPILYGFGLKYLSVYRRLRRSPTHFIIPEDFLRWKDYLAALSYPFRLMGRPLKAPPFREWDLSDLVKEEQRTPPPASVLEAVLVYRLFLRLGEAGLKPQFILDWYENQALDKALIAGARRAFPRARVIGMQMFIFLSNYLNSFPSPAEVDFQMVPHLVLNTSEHQCRVAQSFTRDIRCYPAAAVRFAHIFQESRTIPGVNEPRRALVLLPVDLGEALELLEMLQMTLEMMPPEIKFSLKCHPDYTPEELIQAFGRRTWPPQFEIFLGSLPQALDQAGLAVSLGSSSIIEAVVYGIPVIIPGRPTALNQKIVADGKIELIKECFSPDDLALAINQCLHLSQPEIDRNIAEGKRIRDLFFEPISARTMLPYIGILEYYN